MTKLIEGYDIVIIGYDGWTNWYRRPQLLAIELSKKNRVLYIEPGPPWKNLFKNIIKKPIEFWKGVLQEISRNLYVYSCGFRWSIDRTFIGNRVTMKIEEWYIDRILKQLGMQKPILGYQAPFNSVFLCSSEFSIKFYDCIDEWTAFPGINTELVGRIELEILEHVDIVFATAKGLVKTKSTFNPNIYYLPNAIGEQFLNVDRRLVSIKPFQGITLGFIGGIGGDHTDFNLLEALLNRNTLAGVPFRIVMVGPVIGSYSIQRMELLKNNNNLIWTGPVPYKNVPAYLSAFDFGIIPWIVDDLVKYVDPIKLYEYFSIGIPVISPRWPELEPYENLIYFAETIDEYEYAIKTEYSKHDGDRTAATQQRCQIAQNQTWAARADKMLEVFAEELHRKRKGISDYRGSEK